MAWPLFLSLISLCVAACLGRYSPPVIRFAAVRAHAHKECEGEAGGRGLKKGAVKWCRCLPSGELAADRATSIAPDGEGRERRCRWDTDPAPGRCSPVNPAESAPAAPPGAAGADAGGSDSSDNGSGTGGGGKKASGDKAGDTPGSVHAGRRDNVVDMTAASTSSGGWNSGRHVAAPPPAVGGASASTNGTNSSQSPPPVLKKTFAETAAEGGEDRPANSSGGTTAKR